MIDDNNNVNVSASANGKMAYTLHTLTMNRRCSDIIVGTKYVYIQFFNDLNATHMGPLKIIKIDSEHARHSPANETCSIIKNENALTETENSDSCVDFIIIMYV